MSAAVLALGARIKCRSAEWMVRSLGRSSSGQQFVGCRHSFASAGAPLIGLDSPDVDNRLANVMAS